MNPSEYQHLAHCTEAEPSGANNRIRDQYPQITRLLHAAMGLCTESGEFQDALKRHIFYGSDLDKVLLEEEIGDVMWYVALACNALGVELQDIMERNIAKLKARYPNKFSKEKAENRDLKREREILEGK